MHWQGDTGVIYTLATGNAVITCSSYIAITDDSMKSVNAILRDIFHILSPLHHVLFSDSNIPLHFYLDRHR